MQLAIHHYLMARCPREQIGEIYSKAQALSQCRDWLARNMPHARLVEVGSTALAAELAGVKALIDDPSGNPVEVFQARG